MFLNATGNSSPVPLPGLMEDSCAGLFCVSLQSIDEHRSGAMKQLDRSSSLYQSALTVIVMRNMDFYSWEAWQTT